MKLTQVLEKVDLTFPSPYDASVIVRVYKNPNHAEMSQVKVKSSFGKLQGLLYNQNVVYV